jgi:dipeptidyl aminopeptidase/acylaminoacyl peptidase
MAVLRDIHERSRPGSGKMKIRNLRAPSTFGLGTTLAAALVCSPLAAQEKPTLAPDDYDRWERISGGMELSRDGGWMAVPIVRVDEDRELRIHSTRSDSVVAVPHARGAEFSRNGRWVAFMIGHSEAEREAASESNGDLHDKLGLLDLSTGVLTEREDFASFSFSDDGRFLALQRYKPDDKESEGVDVVVHDLETGTDMAFGNVAEMAWQDGGTLLAMTVDADDRVGNGVTVYDPVSGRIRALDSGQATYRELRWREDAPDLAVYRTVEDEAFEDTAHVAMVWRDLDTDRPQRVVLDESNPAFPASMRIVEFRTPEFSDDGSMLFVGLQERRPAPPACESGDEGEGQQDDSPSDDAAAGCDEDEDAPGVEIWHTLDVDPVPQQRVRERQLRQENWLAVWHIDSDGFVQLSDELTENVTILGDGAGAMGRDETPYDEHAMFRQQFSDLYSIDVATGAKTKVAERVTVLGPPSPEGRYFLWFHDEDWFAYDTQLGEVVNITDRARGDFVDLDVTPTREQMPPFGVAAWLENDEAVLINDEWDVWRIELDGSGGDRLTDGEDDDIRYRIANADLDGDDDGIGSDETIYYTTYGEWTKKAGFAAGRLGDDPDMLVWEDKFFGGFPRLMRAEDAPVFAFQMEGFDDSPDYWVAGSNLASPRQVTETNPFHDDYAWGRTELVDYENEWGRTLQGVLTYPADYDSAQSYPMIVYQYELLSQGMHQYQVPDPTQYYNQQIWSQNGYFVFRPDIVYRDRRPGQSNVETLRPAVAAALEQAPAVDGERVGLIGHSWGGYQTTFFVTQDDLFASAVAGAPLTNLESMYLSFYWNSGGTDARIFEISQGRMQVPWWEDPESYRANSPVHHIQNMNTPLLMMFGTNDGAVEYNQGVEFYNAARRAGKQMVMLSYDGENHGLAQEPNQRDYQSRIMQWFGHYLKGEPAPDWISTGLPYVEQQDRLKPQKPVG